MPAAYWEDDLHRGPKSFRRILDHG